MKYPGIHPDQTVFPKDDIQTWGLTKREYFAALVLQGIAANSFSFSVWNQIDEWEAASRAVVLADTLIKELGGDE